MITIAVVCILASITLACVSCRIGYGCGYQDGRMMGRWEERLRDAVEEEETKHIERDDADWWKKQ